MGRFWNGEVGMGKAESGKKDDGEGEFWNGELGMRNAEKKLNAQRSK